MQELEEKTFVFDEDTLQIVSFQLGREEFAFDISFIQEIIKISQITPVPLSHSYVKGVMNIRGNIIPVVDLRLKMGLASLEFTGKSRIIVVDVNNRRVGLIVDYMNEVITILKKHIFPAPEDTIASDDSSKYIESIYSLDERIISILSIQKLLELD